MGAGRAGGGVTWGREVAYTTALTLVRILEKKGYVTHEAQPAGGRAQSLVVGLLDDEDLSPEELAELRSQIDKKLSGKRGGKR